MPGTKILVPRFEPVTVADKLKDGYWLQAVDINGRGYNAFQRQRQRGVWEDRR
jgi:hypothetical protein